MAAETDEQDSGGQVPRGAQHGSCGGCCSNSISTASLVRLDFPTGTQAVIDQEFLNLDLSGLPSCPGCQAP